MTPRHAQPKTTPGLASIEAAKPRDVPRKGGRAAHQRGAAHRFTRPTAVEEPREAGPPPRGTSEPADVPEPPRRGEAG